MARPLALRRLLGQTPGRWLMPLAGGEGLGQLPPPLAQCHSSLWPSRSADPGVGVPSPWLRSCPTRASPRRFPPPSARLRRALASPVCVHVCPAALGGRLLQTALRLPRSRQAIFEILTSEFSYQHSLGILVAEFLQSRELRATMTQTEHHHLFSNILDVQGASQR